LEKSKFYKGKSSSSIQVSKSNINNIVKIKEKLLNLSAKKIKEIHKVLNESKKKINIITKGPLRKQIIVLINPNNLNRFIVTSNKHMANINKALKDIKSDIVVDFI